MNDSMISWQGSGNLNINAPWVTEESSPAQKKAALEQIKDSLSTTEGGKIGKINGKTYVSASESPGLKAPLSTNVQGSHSNNFGLESLFDIKGKGFEKLMGQFQNMADAFGAALKEETSGSNALGTSIQSQIGSLSDAELKEMAPNLTPEQAKALLAFAAAHMEGVTPELLAVLSQLPPEALKALASLPPEALKALASLSPEALKALASLPKEALEALKNLTPEALASGQGIPKELATMLKGMPAAVLTALQSMPKEALAALQSMPKEVFAALQSMPKEALAALKSVSPKTLSAIASLPPEVAAKAVGIVQKGEVSTGMKLNPDTAVFLDEAGAQIQRGAFAAAMDKAGLSAEDKKIMSLANEIPGLAEALPPEQKQLLAELKQEAFQSTGAEYGIPADWNSAANSNAAVENAGISFDKGVGEILDNLLSEGKISQTEYNQMRTNYFVYNGEGSVKDIVAEMQKSWGLPEDFRLPVMTESYLKMLDGAVFISFQDQIAAVSPPLSAEQKLQLTAALSSKEGAGGLPPNLQEVFGEIKSTAINGVVAEYGLAPQWQPQVESLATAIVNMISPEFKVQQAAINQIKEMLGLTVALNTEIELARGPSHTTISIATYMTSVSSALLGLQQQLYESAVVDAAATKRLSQVQADTNTTRLKKQREDLDEILEKKKKMAGLGGAFQWIIMVFLAAILLPLFAAMMAMMVSGMAKGKGLSGTKGPFDVAAEGVGLPVKAFFIMLTVLCPVLMIVMALIDLMFTGGKGLMEPMLKSFGVPPALITKVLMALQMVTIVAMIVVMVILTMTPGGQAIAGQMAQSMGSMFSGMQSAGSTVAAAAGSAAAAAAGVVSTMGPIGQAAVAAATIVAEAVAFAAQLGVTLMKMFASLVGSLLEGIYSAVGTIVKTVGEAAKAIGQALANLSANATRTISTAASTVAEKLGLESVKQAVMENLAKLLEHVQKFLQKAVHKLGLDKNPAIDAAKQQLQTAQNKLSGLEQTKDQLMLNKEKLQGVLDDALKSGDQQATTNAERQLKVIDQKIAQTNSKIDEAQAIVTQAQQGVVTAETQAANLAHTTVGQIEAMVSSVTGTMQAGVTINNNILEGQIALIKGALEAYKAETDAMLKIVSKVLNNMQNQLQDIASWIKGLTDLQQELMKKMSTTVSRLTSA